MNKSYEINYILESIKRLEKYVRTHNYSGFDPYDSLNSNKIKSLKNAYIKLIATQIFVYSPVNFRKFFKTTPRKSPKALGLFLQAYCNLLKAKIIEKDEFDLITHEITDFLIKNHSTGYSGYCWGLLFDWQDITRYLKSGVPTIVPTSYIGHAFLDLYDIRKERQYLEIAKSCCRFILNDLNIKNTDKGICFSYTPIDTHLIHNANMLGSAFLSRVYSITKDKNLLQLSKTAMDFSVSYQKTDGSWAYSIDPNSEKERQQIDFHQGFNLDALCDFIKYINPMDEKYKNSLIKGAYFYKKKQFNLEGRSNWRLPLQWPIDIHHQAQGISTFTKLFKLLNNKKYFDFSKIIALWTINNMQDHSGYFYYQKWPIITNKISYMRWGQAWMMYSLATLLNEIKRIK
jgi:hypothetical protein